MPLVVFIVALLVSGSCLAWAVLPFGSYVASLPSAIIAAVPAIAMAIRIPKRMRDDARSYLWPALTFAVLLALIALGMSALQGMGARL